VKIKAKAAEQRGRKRGGGILKQLVPRGLSNEQILTELISGKRICREAFDIAREHIGSLYDSDDALKDPRLRALGDRGLSEALVSIVCRLEDDPTYPFLRTKAKWLGRRAAAALILDDAAWFRQMADAIDAVKQGRGPLHLRKSGEIAYTLHAEILSMHIFPAQWNITPAVYTIGTLCDLLEKRGLMPNRQQKWDWRRRVRRACQQLGLPLLRSKAGPKEPTATDFEQDADLKNGQSGDEDFYS
jgi:hypothetical protein